VHLGLVEQAVADAVELFSVENSTRRIGRFRPMPIASVATRMCAWPWAKRSASRRRTSGGSAP